MAEITAALVKAFRDRTGLPMMDCKKALTEADGDPEKALTILREKGKLKMIEKGAERTTEEGVLATACNENGVAMIELLCESAPVAGNPEFLQLAQDIANVYLEKGGQTAEEVIQLPLLPSLPPAGSVGLVSPSAPWSSWRWRISLVARGWRRESPSESCAAQMGLVVQPPETQRDPWHQEAT